MAVKFKDYYETLGVLPSASADDIKQAFRKLARLHHPDVTKNKVSGEEKFKEINEAYEVLGDPEKRRRYDDLGASWQPGGPSPPGDGRPRSSGAAPDFEFSGTGFSDFFESFFHDRPGGFGAAQRTGGASDAEDAFVHPGQDIEADLLVTLEELLRGSQRKVTLRRPGQDGGVARSNTYQVRIPPGMREGQRIRLAGQGESGRGGAATGDLYLRIRLARHPDLSVQGDDLYYDLDLAPWEAVLGAKVNVPALDGTTTLTIPPGTAAGTQLRMRGRGLPRGDGTRGDLYALARLQVPSAVSVEERTHWEQLARASNFNPRKSP